MMVEQAKQENEKARNEIGQDFRGVQQTRQEFEQAVQRRKPIIILSGRLHSGGGT